MKFRCLTVSVFVLALFAGAAPVSAQILRRPDGTRVINPLFSRPDHTRSAPAQPEQFSVEHAQPTPTTEYTRNVQESTVNPTAEQAQKLLEEGNARFVSQRCATPNSGLPRVKDTAQNGQHPFVTILSCSDSRVPLEVVFDRGIGDIFVIRVAGNVTGESETGSIEYGVEHVGTPLLIVLGHTKCGAVTAAATHAHTAGSITGLVNRIQPAVEKAKRLGPITSEEHLISQATVENVWGGIENLMTHSEIVRHLVGEHKLKIVGAIYDVETGKVEWLGEHADMKKLVGGH